MPTRSYMCGALYDLLAARGGEPSRHFGGEITRRGLRHISQRLVAAVCTATHPRSLRGHVFIFSPMSLSQLPMPSWVLVAYLYMHASQDEPIKPTMHSNRRSILAKIMVFHSLVGVWSGRGTGSGTVDATL